MVFYGTDVLQGGLTANPWLSKYPFQEISSEEESAEI